MCCCASAELTKCYKPPAAGMQLPFAVVPYHRSPNQGKCSCRLYRHCRLQCGHCALASAMSMLRGPEDAAILKKLKCSIAVLSP